MIPGRLSRIAGWGRELGAAVADFVFPPRCLICGVASDSRPLNHDLCEVCREELEHSGQDQCPLCSAPVGPHLGRQPQCRICRDESFAFSAAVSLGPYDGPLRQACVRSKQGPDGCVAARLADLLLERERETLKKWKLDGVVPVPHHWIDRLRVPHHPSELVGSRLARGLGLPLERRVLLKSRWTRRQVGLSGTERRRNVRKAFRVGRGIGLEGLRLLLVDDVMTTGSTAHFAARALCEAGAEFVGIAVLARSIGW